MIFDDIHGFAMVILVLDHVMAAMINPAVPTIHRIVAARVDHIRLVVPSYAGIMRAIKKMKLYLDIYIYI